MPSLRALFAALGTEDVATYVRSGNVVFKSSDDRRKLVEAIERRIHLDLGLTVTVLLRTEAQLAKVLAGNPFASGGKDVTKLHVTFLAEKPHRASIRKLDPRRAEPDEFRLVGQEIYLHCPNGYGRSKLTNTVLRKAPRRRSDNAELETVKKLAELACSSRFRAQRICQCYRVLATAMLHYEPFSLVE